MDTSGDIPQAKEEVTKLLSDGNTILSQVKNKAQELLDAIQNQTQDVESINYIPIKILPCWDKNDLTKVSVCSALLPPKAFNMIFPSHQFVQHMKTSSEKPDYDTLTIVVLPLLHENMTKTKITKLSERRDLLAVIKSDDIEVDTQNYFTLLDEVGEEYLTEFTRFLYQSLSVMAAIENNVFLHGNERNHMLTRFINEKTKKKAEEITPPLNFLNILDAQILTLKNKVASTKSETVFSYSTEYQKIEAPTKSDGKPQVTYDSRDIYNTLNEKHGSVIKRTETKYFAQELTMSEKPEEFEIVVEVDCTYAKLPNLDLPALQNVYFDKVPYAEILFVLYSDVSVGKLKKTVDFFKILWKCVIWCLENKHYDNFNIMTFAKTMFEFEMPNSKLTSEKYCELLTDRLKSYDFYDNNNIFTHETVLYAYRKLRYHPIFSSEAEKATQFMGSFIHSDIQKMEKDNIKVTPELNSLLLQFLPPTCKVFPVIEKKDAPKKAEEQKEQAKKFTIYKNIISVSADSQSDLEVLRSRVNSNGSENILLIQKLFGQQVLESQWKTTLNYSELIVMGETPKIIPNKQAEHSEFTKPEFMNKTLLNADFAFKTCTFDIKKMVLFINIIQQVILKGDKTLVEFLDNPTVEIKTGNMFTVMESKVIAKYLSTN